MSDKPLDWADVSVLVDKLAGQIEASGWRPDVIAAVPRGGLIPAALLAHRLQVRRVVAIDVGFTDADRVDMVTHSVPAFARSPRRALVVEDAVDTARLLAHAYGLLAWTDDYAGDSRRVDTRTAALLRRDRGPDTKHVDYVARTVESIPAMPWEPVEDIGWPPSGHEPPTAAEWFEVAE